MSWTQGCLKLTLLAVVSTSSHAATAARIITPSPTDDVIVFEAEGGTLDNSAFDPAKGWAIDGVSIPVPTGASEGSYIVANEDTQGLEDPHNNAIYSIDFQRVGFYSIYIRAAWTEDDLDGDGDPDGPSTRAQNDSLFWGPTGSAPDGVNISAAGDGRANNIGRGWVGNMGDPALEDRDDITNTDWRWLHIFDPPASTGLAGISGFGGPLPVLSFGELDFRLGTREDGLMIDRIALVFQTNTDTITDAYLDGLANTTVVPEPTAGVLAGVFSVVALGRRRNR